MPDSIPVGTLWRGTSLGADGGIVGLYRRMGIINRLGHGGDPTYVDRVGLVDAALAHVHPSTAAEEAFLRSTSFLSFSASREVAEAYARGRDRRTLVPCTMYPEEAVVFELATEGAQATGEAGVYRLVYKCCPSRRSPIHDTDDERLSLSLSTSDCGIEGEHSHSFSARRCRGPALRSPGASDQHRGATGCSARSRVARLAYRLCPGARWS